MNQENLDRDPPSPGKFRFQVVARENSGTGNAASAPMIVTVTLKDVNDNAPNLPMIPPITVEAGEGKREVVKVRYRARGGRGGGKPYPKELSNGKSCLLQVEATDNDFGENAVVTYSIYHVSNNGRPKFKIDPQTGLLTTSGKLIAGEQYSITVQVR